MSRMLRITIIAAGLLAVAGAATVSARARTAEPSATLHGPTAPVGDGSARLYVERGPHGEPTAIGIELTAAAMAGLATHMNTTSRCFDKNGDGIMSHGECLGDYQTTLEMPAGSDALHLPFRWATVNWNPEGHLPPAPTVWSWPHFDFHFFIAEPAAIASIRPGPCGEFANCEDSARASIPLPAHHAPPGYLDVGAVVPAMGNHLVDVQDPELADPSLGFSRTLIYGVLEGKVIFLEPMVSHAFLDGRPDECTPIRLPDAWAEPGYYPTSYCVRYDETAATYRVSLEGMTWRAAR